MNKLLQNVIDDYKNGLLETRNLQISNKNFSTETICGESLYRSAFKNLSFLNLNFKNVNFDSSFFYECSFKNCIFELTSFQNAQFKNCNLINCQIKNCNLAKVDFRETIFNKCCFERVEQGGLVKVWFELCNFLDTNFKGFERVLLIQTSVVDSTFSKFDKSLKFKGEFSFRYILDSRNGRDKMFIEWNFSTKMTNF